MLKRYNCVKNKGCIFMLKKGIVHIILFSMVIVGCIIVNIKNTEALSPFGNTLNNYQIINEEFGEDFSEFIKDNANIKIYLDKGEDTVQVQIGNKKIKLTKNNIFIAKISFSAVVIFAGLRTHVADTTAYINMFNEWPVGFSDISTLIKDSDNPGFILLGVFIKTYISTDYTVWLFIIATITGICMMIGFYRYSSNFALSSFLFIATCNFTWMFNGMRQFLVASILFA